MILAVILELTKRHENLNILLGNIFLGAFGALITIFVSTIICRFAIKIAKIPRKYEFFILLYASNAFAFALLYYLFVSFKYIEWNDYIMAISNIIFVNFFAFLVKKLPLKIFLQTN